MGFVLRTAAVFLAASAPLRLAAQVDVEASVPVSAVTSEELENLPGTPIAKLLETTYAGVAVFDPGTSVAAAARVNYFTTSRLALVGQATAAHIDLGIDDITQIEVLAGAQYLTPLGSRASAGVIGLLGYQDNDGGGDGIYDIGAITRYTLFPAAALYSGVFYRGGFDGGHIWSIESNLMPGKYPGLEGFFTPRRGVWEVNFDGQYQIDPGDFLDLTVRAAPFITDRLQVGADLGYSRDGSGINAFTQTNIEGFGAYHFPMDSRLLPFVGAFGGYQSFTGFDGEGTFGGRAGIKYSCAPTSSVFLEGEYRGFTGDFSESQFGLRLGTNIYAGF